jgi:hypothetical protein
MISASVLALSGWIGLVLLLTTSLPTVGPRWLFFFLLTLAATGSSLPFLWLLNRRFSKTHTTLPNTLLRQALLVALFADICMWLQINRSLTLLLAILIALGLYAIERLLGLIDRSQWRPWR